MTSLLTLGIWLERFVSFFGRLAAWASVPLMLVIIFDVVTRKLNLLQGTALQGVVTSTKLQEAEWHLHTILFLLCLGWAYFNDAHVRIDLLRDRFGPRTKAWIEMLGCLLFLVPYATVVAFYSHEFFWRSFIIDEGSAATTGLPNRWAIKFTLFWAFVLLLLAGLSMFLNRLAYLRGHPVPDHHGGDAAPRPHGD